MSSPRLYPVRFGEKRYSPEFQTEEQYRAAWQRTLARLHAEHAVGLCQCPGQGELPIYIRAVSERYHLARYPDTGPQHAPDCQYFSAQAGEETDNDAANGEPASAPRAPADEVERLQLVKGMRIKEAGGNPREGARNGRQRTARHTSQLADLLHLIWIRAGLNDWHPQWAGRRSLFTINRRLREAAVGVEVNGAPLGAHLMVGAVKTDEAGRAHNEARREAAGDGHTRLLVLAKLAQPGDEPSIDRLRMANYHGIPRVYVARETVAHAERAFAAELAGWRAGEGTIVLAQIEPVAERSFWRAVDLAFMTVTRDYVATTPPR